MKVTYALFFLTLNLLLALRAAEAVPTPHPLRRQLQHHKRASLPPSSSSSSSPPPKPRRQKHSTSKKPKKPSNPTSNHADLIAERRPSPASFSKRTPPSPSSPSPLLLLPDAQSIWQAGSLQLVKWSRKYARRLPNDTTVDIVLMDSTTNRKVHSLKRFVPYAKGSALVYVPDKIQDVTLGLTLELYHGKGQQPIASNVIATATGTPHTDQEEDGARSLTSLMRRSEIHIAQDGRPFSETTIQHDSEADGNNKLRGDSLVVLPREMREEYPNTLLPLELDHSFGVHQKVYTMAPYTLAWKVPARVQELLEYTENQHVSNPNHLDNRGQPAVPTTFLARLKVELVKDQTLEPVSILARNVPAETKFQYLQIHDRVLQDFYRLRVQMVVVQVKGLYDVTQEPSGRGSSDRWDFPADAQVIDRYESITRRFWVSVGAL
ncbi:hypothetical protein CPC16_002748 [Podila verticillata]|nr:hypothetical protein BGZ52_011631 [Haplosporangium bisporale]KAF9206861.1 hypothetical protein BGZ59_011468 [Podila verticillata]KAF9371951.1 hypothetical protein CPC16_002748 [Podila verticillata]KFH73695.1 hypothetical protein MVEG_00909 [Podila verticillata NRRL 6337]